MPIALLTKRQNPTTPASSPQATAFAQRVHPEDEAPERRSIDREAPDSGMGDRTEAGDNGKGRADYLEHEFTHGRSQS